MSTTHAALYDLTLTHLSPDAKNVGIEYGTFDRHGVSPKDLRALLVAATAVAPKAAYPLAPEIRITAPTGRYVVQLKEGRLQFVSWASAKSRGGNPTVDQILGIVSGEMTEGDAAFEAPTETATGDSTSSGFGRYSFIGLMVIVIVGINCFTFWNAKRPPGNFLPSYTLLQKEPGDRVLATVSGEYETGREPGDRRLQIARDGNVVWIKFGPNRSVKQQNNFTVKATDIAGKPGLLTSTNGMINIKDPSTVVYFGDTYVRAVK